MEVLLPYSVLSCKEDIMEATELTKEIAGTRHFCFPTYTSEMCSEAWAQPEAKKAFEGRSAMPHIQVSVITPILNTSYRFWPPPPTTLTM